jgi:hypothetical protein
MDEGREQAYERAVAAAAGERNGVADDDWPGDQALGDQPEPSPDRTAAAALWPDSPEPEAYHGLAGEIVTAMEPQSEADPVGILVQILVAFGNVIGRSAHFQVEADKHYLNLFAVLVGDTAKGRKGTSWGRVRWLYEQVDPGWADKRLMGGLSSGEGLLWNVRDALMTREKQKENGRVVSIQEVESDPGETDKRLFIQESEFAGVLKQIERHGNTLSVLVRQAWEKGDLRILTTGRTTSPVKATGSHVSIVGHITSDELRRYLSCTEIASGFGNRFLWPLVRRSKCLPDGGQLVDLQPFILRLADAVRHGREVGAMERDADARDIWHQEYERLSEGRPGLGGTLLARAEAQTMRLACLYALLDESQKVRAEHLYAALALWAYCERSVQFVFGDSLGDSLADDILAELKGQSNGMTRTEIRKALGHNWPADRLARALGLLQRLSLIDCKKVETQGRSAEVWFACSAGQKKGRKGR